MKNSLKTFLLFLIFSNCSGDREENFLVASGIIDPSEISSSSRSSKIYFDINGTCICPNAKEGDTEEINGITYTVVEGFSSFRDEVDAKNYNLCTTLITDMFSLSAVIFTSDKCVLLV